MKETITVACAFEVSPQTRAAIKAVDPRIRLKVLPGLMRRRQVTGDERERLMAEMATVDIALGGDWVDPALLLAAPKLRWYHSSGAGVERMVASGLLDHGFVVTNSSGLAAGQIAEWVLGTMLMLAHEFPQSLRDQAAHHWNFRWTSELAGKTCGIAGLGAIGRAVAQRAMAFEMRIIASRRTAPPGASDPDCDELLPFEAIDELAARSDYLVLAVPLTPETRHLIGARQLRKMKRTACILNVARGAVIDQPALVKALETGRIAGAALDVFDPEPLPADSPLWDMPNVIVTPHIAGTVTGYLDRAALAFAANLRRHLAGEPLENLVDPRLGY